MTTATITQYDRILVALKEGPATARDLGCSIGHLMVLAGKGLVQFHGVTKVGVGRPAHLYTLTAEGKKAATRIKRKLAR